MHFRRQILCRAAVFAVCAGAGMRAQVIEYEANGLKYQTATRKGLTVIVTQLPNHVAGFGLIQGSVSNGSQIYWAVRPEAFTYIRQEQTLGGFPPSPVVDIFLERPSPPD